MKFFGVPTAQGALGKNGGCEKAPAVLGKLFKVDVRMFDLPRNDIELQQKEIMDLAKKAFSTYAKEKKVFFGGSHDVTFSLFKAFASKSKNSAIILFDAHADCDEGLSTVSHEDFVRSLVGQGLVKAENVLLFGVRKIFESEQDFLEKSGVKVSNSAAFLIDFLKNHKRIYFSFDVDVLDPNVMGATHYLEVNGMYTAEAKELVGKIFASDNVLAADIVEFNPDRANAQDKKNLLEIFGSNFC